MISKNTIKLKLNEVVNKHLINRISVFDFDGTLIDTPTPDIGKATYEEKTGQKWGYKGWWSIPDSLNIDIFEMKPISDVISVYKKEKQSKNTLVIMMTGRIPKLSQYVEKILDINGLRFDEYFYNTGGNTLNFKIETLNSLLEKYMGVESVLLNDDRAEHIETFESWGETLIKNDRLKSFKINFVEGNRFKNV